MTLGGFKGKSTLTEEGEKKIYIKRRGTKTRLLEFFSAIEGGEASILISVISISLSTSNYL